MDEVRRIAFLSLLDSFVVDPFVLCEVRATESANPDPASLSYHVPILPPAQRSKPTSPGERPEPRAAPPQLTACKAANCVLIRHVFCQKNCCTCADPSPPAAAPLRFLVRRRAPCRIRERAHRRMSSFRSTPSTLPAPFHSRPVIQGPEPIEQLAPIPNG